MSVECRYPNGRPVQGENERISYIVDVTEWTEEVSAPEVTEIIDESTGTDVISTVMPSNVATAAWPFITLSLLRALTVGRDYRIQLQFTGGNSQLFETHFRVRCI